MRSREKIKYAKRIVFKIGTSTLSYPNGRLNFQRIRQLAEVLSTVKQQGKEVILVTSGAIGVGAGRLGLLEKPLNLAKKQALAAIGQAELIKIYQKFFEEHHQIVAQVLLTKDIVTSPLKHQNAKNTLEKLLSLEIIPIINENDTISTYEIEFGDNDSLSAMVSTAVQADLLIMLSDIDGLYSADPKIEKHATIINTVEEITPELEKLAAGTGTSFGTGGMKTKLTAAKMCSDAHIDTIITNGSNPYIIFDILEGQAVGTHFLSKQEHPVN
ncbi:MAG: glutamate 5-kinase [Bacteroidales bacterium]|nr:glutamate 5-kinase [Bacteroidales bacterium]